MALHAIALATSPISSLSEQRFGYKHQNILTRTRFPHMKLYPEGYQHKAKWEQKLSLPHNFA